MLTLDLFRGLCGSCIILALLTGWKKKAAGLWLGILVIKVIVFVWWCVFAGSRFSVSFMTNNQSLELNQSACSIQSAREFLSGWLLDD